LKIVKELEIASYLLREMFVSFKVIHEL
ncbi:hypothetical protein Tco_0660600, partial [Tanacetum coccineum]